MTCVRRLRRSPAALREEISTHEYININVGNAIWIHRDWILCVWKKAKGHCSTYKRSRVNGLSLFYLKYIYHYPYWSYFYCPALYY